MVRVPGKLNAACNRINICDLLVTTQRMLVSAINIMHLDGPLKFGLEIGAMCRVPHAQHN